MKKLTSILIAVSMLFAFFVPFASAASVEYVLFADFEDGNLPESLQYNQSLGEISVTEIGSRKAMYIKHDYDGPSMNVSGEFTPVNDGSLTAEVTFLQPDLKKDGEVFFTVNDSEKSAVSIEAVEGDIVLKNTDGTYSVLVDDYFCNKWYTVKVVCDVLNDNASYYVNGELIENDAPFINTVEALNNIKMISNASPGIMVDSIKLSNGVELSAIMISGSDAATIPPNEDAKYTYTAQVTTTGGNVITEGFVWSLEGTYTGVSIESEPGSKDAKLVVSPTAQAGEVVIKVSYANEASMTTQKTVTLSPASPGKIEIIGDVHLSTTGGKSLTVTYDAKVFDQFDNEITGEAIDWSIDYSGCATLSLNNNVLTVSGAMPSKDEFATLTATLRSNPAIKGTKNLLVQPYDVYFSDMQRWNIMLSSLDKLVEEASIEDGSNPLMGVYLSPYTDKYGYWHHHAEGPTAVSNLTEQFMLMRTMDGITAMTGDESYAERVRDMYQHYLDYGETPNKLFYWGNHTYFDLETGRPFTYYLRNGAQNVYHEVEARDIYLDPMRDIDKDRAVQYCKDYFRAIIKDWQTYTFNRHASTTTVADENKWKEDIFVAPDPSFPYVQSMDLSFSSSACTLLLLGKYFYENSDNEEEKASMLRHMTNIAYLYLNTRNPDTKMFGNMFTTSHGAPGAQSIEATYGPNWWTWVKREDVAGNNWGDRARNQFLPMLQQAGRVTPEDEKYILECNQARFADKNHVQMMELAKLYGFDSEMGADINRRLVEHSAGVFTHIYDFTENRVPHVVFTNGSSTAGLRAIRPGYWGSNGTYFGWDKVGVEDIINTSKIYLEAGNRETLQTELEIIWNGVKNMCEKTYKTGDLGDPMNGIAPNLNMGATTSEPSLIRVMLNLYDASGERAYLDFARVVANNMVNARYKNGYLVPNSNTQYIQTEGEQHYVLLRLEEALRGEKGLVPDSIYISDIEIQDDGYDEYLRPMDWQSPYLLTASYDDVAVTEVNVFDEEIVLSLGESKQINVEIYPDDSASKSIIWEIKDKDIVSISDDNTITAKKKGETIAYAVATAAYGVVSEPVRIIVE